ncbi:MAG: hypothetical protein ABFS35_05670 [Bacteroidota bacterium]
MKTLKILLLGTAIIFSGMANAQKLKVVSGKLDFLKGQTALNVEYKYDDMKVGKMTEEDYIAEKVEKYNNDEAGKGDKWKEAWFNDRATRFHPKFEELMNKYLAKKGASISSENNDAEYTLILKTTFTEPGFNVGVMRRPALINTEVIFVKTGSTEELAKITLTKAPGNAVMGLDFDTGLRIQEAYAKSGKTLAGYLIKKAL